MKTHLFTVLLTGAILAAAPAIAQEGPLRLHYLEAEAADASEGIAYRDEGFTDWMGYPSGGRTVIFAGADAFLRYKLNELPPGQYYARVRQLAFAAPRASVELLHNGESVGITDFPQPGTWLAWSKPLGPFNVTEESTLTVRPAPENAQAPYVDVLLLTNDPDYQPANSDQDFASLTLHPAPEGLQLAVSAITAVEGGTEAVFNVRNETGAAQELAFQVRAVDAKTGEETEAAAEHRLEAGAAEIAMPFEASPGRDYLVQTSARDAEGRLIFLDSQQVSVLPRFSLTQNARCISPGEELEIQARVNDPALRKRRLRLEVRVAPRNPHGAEALTRTQDIEGAETAIRIPAGELGVGAHHVQAEIVGILDAEERFLLSVTPWPEEKLPDAKQVSIKNGVIHVNNAPFMPRKLHHVGGQDFVKRQGYNAIDCWGGDTLEGVRKMLDDAHAANLYGYGVLFHPYFYKGHKEGFDLEALREGVNALKDHPALLLWELYDEPEAGVPPEHIEAAYKVIKETDPHHPVIINFYSPTEFKNYAAATDILSIDHYPVPSQPLTNIADYIQALSDHAQGEMPVQVVLQGYAGIRGRMPTPDELRAMTFLAINHGARSFAMYSWAESGGYPFCLQNAPWLWSYTRCLNSELAALEEVILAPMAASQPEAGGMLDVALKETRLDHVLIAVNPTDATVSAQIRLPQNYAGHNKTFRHWDSEAPLAPDPGGGFTITLGPHGVGLYRAQQWVPLPADFSLCGPVL